MTSAGAARVFAGALALALIAPGVAAAKPAKHATRPVAAAHKPAPAKPARSGTKEITREPTRDRPTAAASDGDAPTGSGGDEKGSSETVTTAANGTRIKSKAYSFGAMDVEGKLKTPQLLYFLNRVKLELDMSAPDKRSFMKELGQSADDKNL